MSANLLDRKTIAEDYLKQGYSKALVLGFCNLSRSGYYKALSSLEPESLKLREIQQRCLARFRYQKNGLSFVGKKGRYKLKSLFFMVRTIRKKSGRLLFLSFKLA